MEHPVIPDVTAVSLGAGAVTHINESAVREAI